MNELNNIVAVVMGAAGYHFEPAHPPDCECHEFGSDTAKDGWWKDGDFISSGALKPAHSQLQALITEQVRLEMSKFGLEKGVKYDVKKSNKVIVITPTTDTTKETK